MWGKMEKINKKGLRYGLESFIILLILLVGGFLLIQFFEKPDEDSYYMKSYNNIQECKKIIFEETGINDVRCDDFHAYFGICNCRERFVCLKYADYGTTNQTCLKYNKKIGDLNTWVFDLVEVEE